MRKESKQRVEGPPKKRHVFRNILFGLGLLLLFMASFVAVGIYQGYQQTQQMQQCPECGEVTPTVATKIQLPSDEQACAAPESDNTIVQDVSPNQGIIVAIKDTTEQESTVAFSNKQAVQTYKSQIGINQVSMHSGPHVVGWKLTKGGTFMVAFPAGQSPPFCVVVPVDKLEQKVSYYADPSRYGDNNPTIATDAECDLDQTCLPKPTPTPGQ